MKFKGLTNKEVEKRKQEGLVNTIPKPQIRSNSEIIFSHVFTLFNLYNFVIAGALIYVQAWTSLFFMGIVVTNTFMFAFQEIRSRNLIRKLNIIVAPTTYVIRDGEKIEVPNEELVLDDLVYFEAGDQISADSIIMDGSIEVNESLLTGEIEPIDKKEGSTLLSGSFVVSGACYAKIEHIGEDNYAVKITQAVKKPKKNNSELIHTFKTVTRITSVFIIPIGAILLYQSLVIRDESLYNAFVNTATALMGMLPQGLVLLTTVSLVGSVLKLGSHKTLVQDLYAIEVLSAADVLCLDKTGTLTLGNMSVIDHVSLNDKSIEYLDNFVYYSKDNNATAQALYNFSNPHQSMEVLEIVPFSSDRKWSAVLCMDINLILGAPEFVAPYLELPQSLEVEREKGARILLFGETQDNISKNETLPKIEALMWIAIQDPLREDTKEAIEFFEDNGVSIKVISGDNPKTVSSIAKQAGVRDAQKVIDASTLNTEEELEDAILNYNVIGRATPNQKLEFTKILQRLGKKVAMTGDGINDVLALKNADISIAMGEGSDAAVQSSQIVIMDGKISTLVDVVKEGRQVINSITMSASMYYLRTIMSIFMAITAVAMNVPFPFIPFQITLSNMFIDGFPSFMILFEKNYHKPKDKILIHVLKHSVPNAMAIIIIWVGLNIYGHSIGLTQSTIQTIMFYINGYLSIQLIYRIYKPLNWYRTIVLILDGIGFAIAIYLFWNWLSLDVLSMEQIKLTLILVGIGSILIYTMIYLIRIGLDKYYYNKK